MSPSVECVQDEKAIYESQMNVVYDQPSVCVCNPQDGLLSAGYGDLITRIYNQIPKVTFDGKRLQMVVCSATLHSFEVKKMAVSSHYLIHMVFQMHLFYS